MPRKKIADDAAPRRRRGATAAAVDAETERGLAMRILLYSPKDLIAGLLAFAAACAVITNALFLQSGPHPAPMFGSVVSFSSTTAAPLLPRPRPADADAAPTDSKSIEPRAAEARPVEPRVVEPRPVEPRSIEPRSADPMANLVKTTTATPMPSPNVTPAPASNVVRPPALIPSPPVQITGSRRVAAVQRTLTEYGYGQLKATGTVGADTQSAIQRFERERRMPVTGQVSERLVRELSAMIGHPID
ncbi:peptidoglycan-binding protein [Bradyrhizobium sp.]|uniref:peptidoglycan-binding domain-containing protein n=1 Tax=Bradyrhizobium sp. TaxID=376 RepID=UPI003C3D63B2